MAGPHSQGHTGGSAPSGVELAEQFLGDATVKSGEKARLASSLSTLTEHDMDHIKGQVPQGHIVYMSLMKRLKSVKKLASPST